MNKGIHKNNTYLRKTIGNSGEVIINLNKNDAGLFIDIPIFSLEGISNFNFLLIYSSFSSSNCKYGNHIRANYYYSLYDDIKNNKVYYTDAYNFVKEYTYFNIEYTDTCRKYYYKYDDDATYIEKIQYLDNLNVDYNLFDKFGNKIIMAYDKNYPIQIILKNGDTFTFENANRIVDNKGTIIEFSSDFLELKVFKNNIEIYKVSMIIEDNYLSKIIHYKPIDDQLYHMLFANEYVFDDVNKQIIIKDGLSNYAMLLNYSIENNVLYVDSYIEDYTNVFENSKKNSILYYDTYTKILYNSGYYIDYYFNDNQYLIKKIESTGQIEIFEYDQNHNIINALKNLNHAYTYVNDYSIFNCYLSYNNPISSDSENEIVEDNSIPYAELIGNKALLIDNSVNDNIYSAEINANGLKGDYISFFLWSSLVSETSESTLCITINLYKDNEIVQTIFNEVSNQNWNFNVFSDEVCSNYDKIKISISSTEGSIYKINGVSIFQKSFISNIEYDDNSNLINYKFMSNKVENIYSNNKLFQQYSTTNLLKQTNYNSDDLVENKIFGNGTFQKVSYNDSNQIIGKKISIDDRYMESIYTYENNFLKTERDSKNRLFEYNVNILNGLLNSITNEYDEIESFVYDNDNNITEIRKSKNDESRYIQVVYQKFNKIPLIYKILLQNGAIYEYAYDVYDQLVSIDYYNINNVIEKRRLVTYTYYNDGVYSNGHVKTIKMFNDLYTRHYEYDKFYNVIRIYYTAYMTGGNIVTKEYNDNGNLVKEIRGNQNNIVNYLYDELNRIKNITNSLGTSFDYTYDEYNKLVSKKSNVLNKVSYAQYQNKNLSNINPSNAIATDLQMLPDYYCNFYNNYSENGDILFSLVNQNVVNNKVLNSYKQLYSIENYDSPAISLINNIRCFNLHSSVISPLIYQLNDLQTDFNMQTICFWFNANDNINGKTIFYTDKSEENPENNAIRVYFSNNKIHAKIYPDTTNSNDVVQEISIDENIEQFKWYFVSISWMSRQDDPTSPDVFEFRISLNDKFAYFEKSNPRFHFSQRVNQEFFIGGEYSLEYNFIGYIGPIVFQNTSYLTDGRLLELFYLTKPCVLNDRKNKTVEALTLYEGSSSSNQLFPLNSTLNSLNNIKPYYFENREGFKYDINKNFSFNPITQRYAYLADGAILQYNFDTSNGGPTSTGVIRFKLLIQEDHFKQYIFQYKTRNNVLISIYRNNAKKLVYEYKIAGNESTKIETNILVQTNQIINFRFLYYQVSELYSNVSIYVDSIVWHHTTSPLMLEGGIITLGRSVNIELNVISDGVYYSSNNPLFGLIEHLEYGFDINVELSMWNVKNYSNEYNAFGLLVQENNSYNDNLELVKKYKYVEEFIDGKYKVSSLIKEEEFSFNNSTITYKYSYDLLGRIIKISTNDKYVTYEYNFDGSLYRENHYIEEENAGILQNAFIYEYDENANITKINQIDSSSNYSTLNNYTYDSSYPDRVSSIGRNIFKYDVTNHLYPIAFGTFDTSGNQLTGFTFTWNDALLSSASINGNTFYYTYDHAKKLKLTKRINNSITYFYYDDNDLLIKEVSDDIIKEYIYDINLNIKEILITKNNIVYRYIYLRDILGNVVGLLDDELNQVASYEYYAFGRIKSQSTTVTFPFNLLQENPFKYRGYYYDSSLYMYLCKNRYYMNEYGRWLSPDSPNYLEPNDINGMNLFCYCYNNPISYVDLEGNDAILVIEHGGEGLPIVGHALLLFQDAFDNWHLTEFRNGTGGSGLKTCINLELLCGENDDPLESSSRFKTENNIIYKLLDFLNLGGYDYIRLKGDYSGCLKLAEKYKDPTNTKYNNNYNLFTNNCLHYVNELLKKGYSTNPTVQKFIVNSEEFVPITFLNNVEEKQKIKIHIRVYVPVIQN